MAAIGKLSKRQLDIVDCRAKCGCQAAWVGCRTGLAKGLVDGKPKALYVHCLTLEDRLAGQRGVYPARVAGTPFAMKRILATATLAGAVLAGGALAAAPVQAATVATSDAQAQDELDRARRLDEQRLRDQAQADFTRIRDAIDGSLSTSVQSAAQQIRR